MRRRVLAATLAALVGLPMAARAQQAGPTSPPANRLKVERVKSGLVMTIACAG